MVWMFGTCGFEVCHVNFSITLHVIGIEFSLSLVKQRSQIHYFDIPVELDVLVGDAV